MNTTLEEFKAYLQLDVPPETPGVEPPGGETPGDETPGEETPMTPEDELLLLLLGSAEKQAMNYIGYDFTYGLHRELLTVPGSGYVYLKFSPVKEINTLKINGVKTSRYELYTDGIIHILYPGCFLDVEYTAGFENIPEDLKTAIFIIAEALYNLRGTAGMTSERLLSYNAQYITGLPPVAETILMNYKRIVI